MSLTPSEISGFSSPITMTNSASNGTTQLLTTLWMSIEVLCVASVRILSMKLSALVVLPAPGSKNTKAKISCECLMSNEDGFVPVSRAIVSNTFCSQSANSRGSVRGRVTEIKSEGEIERRRHDSCKMLG